MAINFLDGIAVDGDVTIGPVASSAGLLHVSAGTSGDARVVIHADTDNSDENDVPQIWFKADGDITEGLIGLNNNYLDFVSNVSGLNGFRYFTGTTNNTGTTDPYTNATEKMRLTNAGDLGIGTTSPSQKLEVSGKAKITTSLAVGAITPSTTVGRIDASNDIVAFSNSDIRLKDNIKNIDKALDKVNSIQGIEFDWIEKEEVHGNSGHDIGVIAQEIEKILPDIVTTRDSGYKAVKYEKIVPLLIEAIKDLSKQVDGLKRLI